MRSTLRSPLLRLCGRVGLPCRTRRGGRVRGQRTRAMGLAQMGGRRDLLRWIGRNRDFRIGMRRDRRRDRRGGRRGSGRRGRLLRLGKGSGRVSRYGSQRDSGQEPGKSFPAEPFHMGRTFAPGAGLPLSSMFPTGPRLIAIPRKTRPSRRASRVEWLPRQHRYRGAPHD
jgi:hypothetical protein